MTPSAWTISDWLIVGSLFLGGVGFVLKAQHSLITKLLTEKWDGMVKRQDDVEEQVDNIDRRLTGVEAVCKLRHGSREEVR